MYIEIYIFHNISLNRIINLIINGINNKYSRLVYSQVNITIYKINNIYICTIFFNYNLYINILSIIDTLHY